MYEVRKRERENLLRKSGLHFVTIIHQQVLLVWQTLPKWFWLSTKAVYKILLELYIVLNNLLKEINAFHSFKVKYITEDETNLLNEINPIYTLIFTFIIVLSFKKQFFEKNSHNQMQQRICF